jgi:hypothetical protein
VLQPLAPAAVPPSGLTDVTQVAVIGEGACALRRDGSVTCWGGSSPPPGLGPVSQLHATSENICAVMRAGSVACWGSERASWRSDALAVQGVRQVVNGGGAFCTLDAASRIFCWSDTGIVPPSPPTPLMDIKRLQTLSRGGGACALGNNGSVTCWGNSAATRIPADLGTNVTSLTGGDAHFCALSSNGAVRCWGGDWSPATLFPGPNDTNPALVPVNLEPTRQLVSGPTYNCALGISGTIRCWGSGLVVATPPVGAFAQLFGLSEQLCAKRANGTFACWGELAGGFTPPTPEGITQWLNTLPNTVDVTMRDGVYALAADGSVRQMSPTTNATLTTGLTFPPWPSALGSVVRMESGCLTLSSGSLLCERYYFPFSP